VPARLVSSAALTAQGAEKETRHVVLDLSGSGLSYAPGDSLGVWPQNNPDEVELLLAILRAKGSEGGHAGRRLGGECTRGVIAGVRPARAERRALRAARARGDR
jgi:sulfite reductase alpha subunit-like flavoprotein